MGTRAREHYATRCTYRENVMSRIIAEAEFPFLQPIIVMHWLHRRWLVRAHNVN